MQHLLKTGNVAHEGSVLMLKTTGWSATECKDLDMQLLLTLDILKLFAYSCICVIHLHMDKQLKSVDGMHF